MQKSTFIVENKLAKQGYDFVIGIDEVGRGPLAGPVVACAVIIKNLKELSSEASELSSCLLDLVRDSKKLSAKQREKIFDFIHENFYVGIGSCDHKTIDRINILEATYLAMKKAIQDLMRHSEFSKSYKLKAKSCILVDGNKKIPNLSMEQRAIVGGDKIVKSISAASIVAKVMRDRLMLQMHNKYPKYAFDKHKGYGTALHMENLQKWGPCEIHRQSFAPVSNFALAGNSFRKPKRQSLVKRTKG
jgi:ribonuclease HII